MSITKYTVLDLFAGIGGLSYAFHKNTNFEVPVANEILREPTMAYSLNYPNTRIYNCDIRKLSLKKIQEDIGKVNFDIVLGGPPCQSYSTAGKRDIGDPRTFLFKEYYRILGEARPKVFIFENVRGILSIQKGELFSSMLNIFRLLGYNIQFKILNFAEYGVPQIRERVIVVGTQKGYSFEFPETTHGNGKIPFLRISDAISDLPLIKTTEISTAYATEPKNNFQILMRKNSTTLRDHNAPKNNKQLVKIMELLKDGETPLSLPEALRPTSGFKNCYAKLWWDRPSTTITRNLGTPSSARCIHPRAPRPLTTREGARLQTFPDDFIFFGSRGKKNLQVGEAVPPVISSALLNSIEKTFRIREKATLNINQTLSKSNLQIQNNKAKAYSQITI